MRRHIFQSSYPAIPLATTDLSCGRGVKDLTCRRYAADEMTTDEAFGHDRKKHYTLSEFTVNH